MALSWKTAFTANILTDTAVFANTFKVKIWFDVTTTNYQEQLIAIDRMKFFLQAICPHKTIAALEDNEKLVKIMKLFAATDPMTLPTYANDEQVAACILSKLISIVEGRLDVYSIELSSEIGGDVETTVLSEELDHYLPNPSGFYGDSEIVPWWLREDAGVADYYVTKAKARKMVSGASSWADHFLAWDGSEESLDNYVPQQKVPEKRGFSPKIIDGGKK